jgi:hypothetical protein
MFRILATTTVDATTTPPVTVVTTPPSPSVVITPTSTYHYQTLSWLPPSFSIALQSLLPSNVPSASIALSSDATATPTGNAQNIPAVIAPNVNAIIPGVCHFSSHKCIKPILTPLSSLGGNIPVNIKFNSISYVQMVADPVLTAQFVQAIPLLITSAVDLTPDQVIVISIISANGVGSTRRKVRRSSVGGIVTTLSIPQDQVDALQQAIRDPTSNLYSPSNGQLAYLLDTKYPLTNNSER